MLMTWNYLHYGYQQKSQSGFPALSQPSLECWLIKICLYPFADKYKTLKTASYLFVSGQMLKILWDHFCLGIVEKILAMFTPLFSGITIAGLRILYKVLGI